MATQVCAKAGYRVNLLSEPQEMEALAPAWEQLWRAGRGDAWMSYAWRRTWWEHFGAGKRIHIYAVAAEPAGELAGLLALCAETRRGVRRLATMGHDSQRHRPISAVPLPTLLASIGERLAEDRNWDVLELNALERATAEALSAACARHGLPAWRGPIHRQRYIPMQRSWNAILADMQPTLISNVRRRQRHLRNSGVSVNVRVLTAPGEIAAHFDECLRIEASGWKGHAGTAINSDPALAAFYRQLAERLAAEGLFQLFLLCVDERPIAFQFCVVSQGALSGIKMGYDDAWRRFAPGLVLQMEGLRLAHAQGFTETDFLGGDDPYKADWTPWSREIQSLRVYNRTARGWSLHLRRHAQHGLAALAAHSRHAALRAGQPLFRRSASPARPTADGTPASSRRI